MQSHFGKNPEIILRVRMRIFSFVIRYGRLFQFIHRGAVEGEYGNFVVLFFQFYFIELRSIMRAVVYLVVAYLFTAAVDCLVQNTCKYKWSGLNFVISPAIFS